MTHDPEQIAAGLSEAQKRALLRAPDDTPVEIGGKITLCRNWFRAKDVGAKGQTLSSLQVIQGVDPVTLECGPCLVTDDWSREGRLWSLTDLGLAVRALISKDKNND